ncbi:MAG: 2'-5' RNA ligase family protein [Clostridiales bacterium]|nr:2'-5' RNA ligase family protein [Clostridiales bacterium]
MRCIHVFPRFKETDIIESIRKKYDYLYGLIEPHITLVFPFESDIKREVLREEIELKLKNFKPFKLSVSRVETNTEYGYYLFLSIDEGKDILKSLSDELYQGQLKPFQASWDYKPHITIGRFENGKDLLAAYKEISALELSFETIVDRVYVEVIGEKEEAIIDYTIKI